MTLDTRSENRIVESILDRIGIGYALFFLDPKKNFHRLPVENENPEGEEIIRRLSQYFGNNEDSFQLSDYADNVLKAIYTGDNRNLQGDYYLFVGMSKNKAIRTAYDLNINDSASGRFGGMIAKFVNDMGWQSDKPKLSIYNK